MLHAYITVMADRARASAKAADAELRHGERRGPLHGVPLGLKDLIACAGVRMTAGSRVLTDHVPERDADVTERLTGPARPTSRRARRQDASRRPMRNSNSSWAPREALAIRAIFPQ